MTRGRSSAKADVNQLIRDAGYNEIGEEKTKREYHDEARMDGAKNFHDVSYNTPFKNSKTMDNNKTIIKNINQFIRTEYKCYSIRDITPQMVADYLADKIPTVQSSTFFRCICPAVNNLESMLNRVGVKADFQTELKAAKAEAAKECEPPDKSSRNYGDMAESIIAEIRDPVAQFCCHLQLEYGLRVNESYKIHLIDQPNCIEVHQKGGNRTIKAISPQDYGRLVELSGGKTDFYCSNYQKQQYQFATACERAGVECNGTHGLRATYACRSYDSHIADGCTDAEAKAYVSAELGHERLEIVDEYLRGR